MEMIAKAAGGIVGGAMLVVMWALMVAFWGLMAGIPVFVGLAIYRWVF